MPTFPIVLQSGSSLDPDNMKYVRSHVTRQSMQKRRLQDRGNTRFQSVSARRRKASSRQTKVIPEVELETKDDKPKSDHEDCRARSFAISPNPQILGTGTAADFCTVDLPREELFKLLGNYQDCKYIAILTTHLKKKGKKKNTHTHIHTIYYYAHG
jgi:hypothetical protein